jgi:hypothetical protein
MFTPEEKRTIISFVELISRKLGQQLASEKPSQKVSSQDRLIPVAKWNDHHNWPTIGALRNLIFMKHSNGFAKCIRRLGRRVLISEKDFFEWVDENSSVN